MEVTPPDFRSQIEWLDASGEFSSLDEVVDRLGQSQPSDRWVLTFDDGYRDVFLNAYPLLEKRRIPFTLYLTTSFIESGERFPSGVEPLRWDDVEAMMSSGLVTIGAHTHTHPDLRQCDREAIDSEIASSNELIGRRLGIMPRHFAYPKGYWSAEAEAAVAANYESATLGAGPPLVAGTHPLRIHRYAIQRADRMIHFRRKVRSGMRLEEKVRRVLRGYEGPEIGATVS